MKGTTFFANRNSNLWAVRETKRFIFHISPDLVDNPKLKLIIENADARFEKIADILQIDYRSAKANEMYIKINHWIHSNDIFIGNLPPNLSEEDFAKIETLRKTGAIYNGTANSAGVMCQIFTGDVVHFEAQTAHEEAHLIWIAQAGQAPAILNEGVATYAEYLFCGDRNSLKLKLQLAWQKYMPDSELLKNMMTSEFFWSDIQSKTKAHTYDVGAALVLYIIEKWGAEFLRDIFRNTFYEDDNLATLLENKTKQPICCLYDEITKFLE